MSLKKQEYLSNVLSTHRMSHVEELVNKFKAKRDEVKTTLQDKYGSDIYSPFDSGSFKKHTAINIKFDLDIVVPFKRNSFDTLEKMFDDLYEYLEAEFGDVAEVRKQKVSIGLLFKTDDDGDDVNLDVVPGREFNQDQYSEDRKLNLHLRNNTIFTSDSTYIQTNIQEQIEHINGKSDERMVIRLLKIWKHYNNEDFKSFLIELITIKAFKKDDISGNLWEKLEGVMNYIKENVIKEDFKLKDPGNSNNNVMDTLDNAERTNLSNRMETLIDRINNNAQNIKSYFPLNDDFEDEESSSEGYGIKIGSGIASTPPSTERFG